MRRATCYDSRYFFKILLHKSFSLIGETNLALISVDCRSNRPCTTPSLQENIVVPIGIDWYCLVVDLVRLGSVSTESDLQGKSASKNWGDHVGNLVLAA